MAAAAATIDRRAARAAFEARARELAEAKHAVGTARWLGENAGGALLLAVASQSAYGDYLVRLGEGWGSCDCLAGQHGQPCKHLGAALHAVEMRDRAIARAAAMTEAEAMRLLDIYGWV